METLEAQSPLAKEPQETSFVQHHRKYRAAFGSCQPVQRGTVHAVCTVHVLGRRHNTLHNANKIEKKEGAVRNGVAEAQLAVQIQTHN